MFGPDHFATHAILESPDDRYVVEKAVGQEGRFDGRYDDYHKGYVLTFCDGMSWSIRRQLIAMGVRTAVTVVLS